MSQNTRTPYITFYELTSQQKDRILELERDMAYIVVKTWAYLSDVGILSDRQRMEYFRDHNIREHEFEEKLGTKRRIMSYQEYIECIENVIQTKDIARWYHLKRYISKYKFRQTKV